MPQPPFLSAADTAYLRSILSHPILLTEAEYYHKAAGIAAAVTDLYWHTNNQHWATASFLIMDLAESRARDSIGLSTSPFRGKLNRTEDLQAARKPRSSL